MLISRNWLQTFFDKELPSTDKLAEALTFHSFEIEEVTKKGADEILDVKVLPNRAHDCLSHQGIANEISAILDLPLKVNYFRSSVREISETNIFSLKIETDKVKRFKAVLIEGVEVEDSPEWLRQRIESMGGKSINNIVDITNFVMFELGQPMHAFDADKVIGEKKSFIVRESKGGEKIITLDGVERTLNDGSIVITDGGKTEVLLGIAGVKGGACAEITKNTKNIILEAATFDAETIRKTASVLNIKTDASKRFENGLSPEIPPFAIDLALKLIEQEAKGENFVIKGGCDYQAEKRLPYKIGFSISEVNDILGTKLAENDIEDILRKLSFVFELKKVESTIRNEMDNVLGKEYKAVSAMQLDAPNYFSCSSLVSYLYVEAGVYMPSISVDKFVYGDTVSKEDLRFGDLVFSNTGDGKIYFETVEYMAGTKVDVGVDHLGVYIGDGNVLHSTRRRGSVVIEKISDSDSFKNIVGYRRMADINDERYVVEIPFYRLDLRLKEDLIEEIGRIYGLQNIPTIFPSKIEGVCEVNEDFYKAESVREALVNNGYSEVYTYAMVDSGLVEIENPIAGDKKFLRSSLKGNIEKSIELNKKNLPLLKNKELKVFEIGSIFMQGSEKIVVALGETNGKNIEIREYELNDAFKEFSGGVMIDASRIEIRKDVPLYKRISPYPFALRDIALWVGVTESSEAIKDIIIKNAGEFLVRVDQFDEYKKDDRISFAYHLVFQSDSKTLTEEEINRAMNNIIISLKEKGFEIR